jgi:hypothetical protein
MDTIPVQAVIAFVAIFIVGSISWLGWYCGKHIPNKRKGFLISEMTYALNTRESINGTDLTAYCKTILQHIEKHSDMQDSFKLVYTYGEYEICTNWYPLVGLFEFTLPCSGKTIAKIYYPT